MLNRWFDLPPFKWKTAENTPHYNGNNKYSISTRDGREYFSSLFILDFRIQTQKEPS